MNFESTRWSLVVADEGDDSAAAREALGALCEAYWYPMYAFVRRRGADPDAARDVTQGFLTSLVERNDFERLRPERGPSADGPRPVSHERCGLFLLLGRCATMPGSVRLQPDLGRCEARLRPCPRYHDGMTCPACGQLVSDSHPSCPSCGVTLPPPAPGPPSDPDIELVSLLRTGDPAELAVVTSLLESDEIDYFVRGDRTQDLLGAGRVGMGFNLVTGPAEIIVRAEDAPRARSLLNGDSDRPAKE